MIADQLSLIFSRFPQSALFEYMDEVKFQIDSAAKHLSGFMMLLFICFNVCGSLQGLPQVLLCRVHFLKEMLLLPSLGSGDEKVIGGLACLFSEVGQAVSMWNWVLIELYFSNNTYELVSDLNPVSSFIHLGLLDSRRLCFFLKRYELFINR